MKKTKWYIIIAALTVMIIGILIPTTRYISDDRLLSMSEDEFYSKMCEVDTDRLIKRIIRMEKRFPEKEQKTKLLPAYTALMDRADSFSEDQLIKLIEKKKTLYGIDCAFVRMYNADGYSIDRMALLLDSDKIADDTKEYIVSQCDFSLEQLCDAFEKHDGEIAIVAAKKIAIKDSDRLMELVSSLLRSSEESISEEKSVAICLAIAKYYEDADSDAEADMVREKYAPIIQQIYEQGNSEMVKRQSIYALGRICDNELFAWIIDNNSIDKYTKISVIERNIRQMIAMIESARSEEDISYVIKAMKIIPYSVIGDALQDAIDSGNLQSSDELTSLISYIKENGVPYEYKYE